MTSAVRTLTPDAYHNTITSCVGLLVGGRTLEDIFTDPAGPVSNVVGLCDIETLEAAVLLAAVAYEHTVFGPQWHAQRMPS